MKDPYESPFTSSQTRTRVWYRVAPANRERALAV
jgi:hypothetical protein